ncbi:MAG: 50S ribosomal protein L35 [Patescibacteria group bacterium]|nr:50S ribosomal protein L35 [Patescibacteria group bacterium]
MKTQKSVSKRITVTKTGKLLKRAGGQDHFNSHESGNTTRNKRRDKQIGKTFEKTIKQLAQTNR